MHRSRLILITMLLLALLCGCVQTAPQEPAAAPAPAEQTEEVLPTEFRQEDVQNNGGYFLGLGRYVYYRDYPVSSFTEPALWGEFLRAPKPDTPVSIRVYDTVSRSIVAEIPDDGCGGLWFANGRLWLLRNDGIDLRTYTLAPNGKERHEFGPGEVKGVTEDGTLLCIAGSADCRLSLWRNGENVALVKAEGDEQLTYCGFAGNSVIYLKETPGKYRAEICQLDSEGNTIVLGLTHEMPEMEGISMPEFEQMVVDGNDVWMVFTWYQGTGHFYYDSRAVKLKLGVADSVESYRLPEKKEEDKMAPPILRLAEPGKVELVSEKEGLLRISEDETGSLEYCDSSDSSIRLINGFIPGTPYENGGKFLQTAEIVGDSAYLAVADATRDAAGDVGWRYAFALEDMTYLRVPLKENSTAETLSAAPQD